jgi:hypothetical protein
MGRLRILVCGDRNWSDGARIKQVLEEMTKGRNVTIIDGAAKGADSLASEAAVELGLENERYPAAWKQLGKRAGPIRNQEMLDSGIDMLLAFHPNLDESKGTRDMVKRAKKAGVTCYLFSS